MTGLFSETRYAGPEPGTIREIAIPTAKSTSPITFQAMAATSATGDPEETHQASGSAVTPTNTSSPPAQAANHGFSTSPLATPTRNAPPAMRTTMTPISHDGGITASSS